MPVDDNDFFENINETQWSWYQAQIMLDKKEKFELLRDVAEHNAMFWNSEGVQQVRDARENSFATPDDDFESLIENTFGREVPPESKGIPLTNEDIRSSSETLNPYLDMDLDEIEFIPYNESKDNLNG